MIYKELNTRYEYLRNTEYIIRPRYDYKKNGLLRKLIPQVWYKSKNKVTNMILSFVETEFVSLMKYVEELKQFKNWNYHKY